jgi:lysophospholipase L1-like esterase
MKFIIYTAILITLNADAGISSGDTKVATYEGLVASRARQLTQTNSPGNFQTQSRSAHIATENLTSIRVAFAAFYAVGSVDTGLGATTTITASVEYNGTFTQLNFSNSPSGSIPNAGVLFSDYASVSIPSGATFWIRNLRTSTGGIFYNAWQNTFLSEATEVAASGLTDKTMSGTIVDSGAGWSVPPLAILGMTTNPSVIIVGDSIAAGFHDTEDSSHSATGFNAKVGVIARSLGKAPFLNLAVNGENAYTWSADATGRNQLIQKGSHFLCELGLSDIINHGKTEVQTETALQSVYALAWARQKIYQTTLTPNASDTGTPAAAFTTLNQQTALNNTERTTFNNAVRATLPNTLGKIEVAGVLESSLNSNLWIVTPSPPYVFDNPGVHPNPAGYLLVQNANILPAITWP